MQNLKYSSHSTYSRSRKQKGGCQRLTNRDRMGNMLIKIFKTLGRRHRFKRLVKHVSSSAQCIASLNTATRFYVFYLFSPPKKISVKFGYVN